MLMIKEVKVPFLYQENELRQAIYSKLSKKEKKTYRSNFLYLVQKESIDARKKQNLHKSLQVLIFSLEEKQLYIEKKTIKDLVIDDIDRSTPFISSYRPVVVGLGPSGLFAAYYLALAGQKPIIIEQGEEVEDRQKRVYRYWQKGILHNKSNVQFGEGGAGTFSDGKLVTSIKDDLLREVLQSLVLAGAKEDILLIAKPHIGTDKLPSILKYYRQKLLDLGATIYYRTEVVDLAIEPQFSLGEINKGQKEVAGLYLKTWSDNDNLTEQICEKDWFLPCREIILATGHSSRELYYKLAEAGLALTFKNTALGLRVEHRQKFFNELQYGKEACSFYQSHLPTAAYKVTQQTDEGRGVYSFCMCPGGLVVASSSMKGCILTNGMSRSDRNSKFANAALLVTTTEKDYLNFLNKREIEDFEKNSKILQLWRARCTKYPVLAGIYLQLYLEVKAGFLSPNQVYAPAQTIKSFLAEKTHPQKKYLDEISQAYCKNKNNFSYRPSVFHQNLEELFPNYLVANLREAILKINEKMSGFISDDVLLIAPETRSSAPLRINRNKETGESSIAGLFAAGEGAGFAGGISSSAVDGIKQAKNLLKKRRNFIN